MRTRKIGRSASLEQKAWGIICMSPVLVTKKADTAIEAGIDNARTEDLKLQVIEKVRR